MRRRIRPSGLELVIEARRAGHHGGPLPAADLAGLYIAQDDGFFAQQGLHVTIEKIASSAAVITEQEAGQVDITAGG
jgi:ABC-type nitrate/sulfonate/bicarbonate transport system substrate-binding protein